MDDSNKFNYISKYTLSPRDFDKIISKIYNFENANLYFKNRFFLFFDKRNQLCGLISNTYLEEMIIRSENPIEILAKFSNTILEDQKLLQLRKIYVIEQEYFEQVFNKHFSLLNTVNAKYKISFNNWSSCAKNTNYLKNIFYFLLVLFCCLVFCPTIFMYVTNITYLIQILFRVQIILNNKFTDAYSIIRESDQTVPIDDSDLPIYTILVPLYQEYYKLKSIIEAVNSLNYPKDKMDVKLIIEEDDQITLRALSLIEIGNHIHVIKVPFSLPRTKPKALNYAMNYVLGEYVVIYDAEDVPEPDQLRKAIAAFRKLPNDYMCLQARLNFYNSNENILTRFFSIEYGLLFKYLLKGIAVNSMPLPLGGTSNHFKVAALNEIGRWDAYNVTEDADIGIRLAARNYKTYVIDSDTFEESPISISNWLYQRSRWIKGFIQTSFIFLNDKTDKQLSLRDRLSVYIFLCLSPYGFFCVPWMLLIGYFISDNYITKINLFTSVISAIYLYGTCLLVMLNSHQKPSKIIFIFTLLIWPLYFILHVVACYISVFQTITNPFKWNKTKHGESKKDPNYIDEG